MKGEFVNKASASEMTASAGQGTVALELLQQVPHLDAIVVPVSGGGLISGISIAAKAIKPDIVIIAAEPVGDVCSFASSH